MRWLACLFLVAALSPTPGCRSTELIEPEVTGSVGVGIGPGMEELLASIDQGTVALVLPPLGVDRPERVVLAMRTSASPEQVMAVLHAVEDYPRTMPAIENVEVRDRGEHFVTYDVELKLPIQNMHYTLRNDYCEENRIDLTGVAGALLGGRWCWEAFGDSSGCTVVYTSESDIGEEAGFVIRRFLELDPDLQEGMAFAQGLRLLRSICMAAEDGSRRTSE